MWPLWESAELTAYIISDSWYFRPIIRKFKQARSFASDQMKSPDFQGAHSLLQGL